MKKRDQDLLAVEFCPGTGARHYLTGRSSEIPAQWSERLPALEAAGQNLHSSLQWLRKAGLLV